MFECFRFDDEASVMWLFAQQNMQRIVGLEFKTFDECVPYEMVEHFIRVVRETGC